MSYTNGLDDPTKFFQAKAYAGTGSSNAVTYDGNSDMQPDLLWFKNRQQALNWMMWDSVRGITKYFYSNLNEAEGTTSTVLTAIGSDGFTVGANNNVNQSSNNIINYGWKAGTSFTNDASGTGIGTIDSAGSASTASGFSIVSWTGTGSAGTIAHGLGKLPKMIIAKQRNTARNWVVYFLDTTIANNNVNNYLELDTTAASTGDSGGRWGAYANYSTTTFGVGTDNGTNDNGGTYIAYVFSDIQAYSKIGKYVGNGNADGTFIYTGFKPAWVLIKATSQTGEGWFMFDNKRDVNNAVDKHLTANLSNAEASGSHGIDFVSNGIKIKNSGDGTNTSGGTYIYMAFAENPFVTSTGVPATAR